MKKLLASSLLAVGLLSISALQAEEYEVDTKGMHAAIQFRVKHLGYSWLYGRFNKFNATFSYDEAKPEDSKAEVTVDTTSLDSNHAERDKHIRSDDYLDVEEFPEAKFVSTGFTAGEESGTGVLKGDLTLKGETKPIEIEIEQVGAGDDPWGGFRRGFSGKTRFKAADFGIDSKALDEVELMIDFEGIRK